MASVLWLLCAVIFALKAGTKFSRLETFYFACTALAALIVGRAAIVAILYKLRGAVAPRVIIIGDGTVFPGNEVASSSIDVRTLDWEPRHDKPEILERIFRRLRGADRILLSFSDPGERTRWAQVMRLTGLNAEVVEPRLEEVAPLGLYHWGRVPTLVIARSPLGLQERAVKRGFDLILVILAAPVVLPLVALLAVSESAWRHPDQHSLCRREWD